MFCPNCRKSTKTADSIDKPTTGKRCATCKTLLASTRISSEFPTVYAAGSRSLASVTLSDIVKTGGVAIAEPPKPKLSGGKYYQPEFKGLFQRRMPERFDFRNVDRASLIVVAVSLACSLLISAFVPVRMSTDKNGRFNTPASVAAAKTSF